MTPPKDHTKLLIDMSASIGRIEAHIESAKGYQDDCVKDRRALYDGINGINVKIGVLQTKQKLVTWVGSIASVSVLGVCCKWLATHLKP